MNRLTPLSAALAAILLLGLFAAQTAFAEEGGNPIILPEPTETTPQKFTSNAGVVKIEDAGSILLECSSGSSKGEFTSKRLGIITMVFKGCAWMTHKCQNKGNEAGVISFVNADLHLVALKIGGTLRLGMVVKLPNSLPVECWLGAEFRGSMLGLIDGPGSLEKTKSATLLFHESAGKQELKECELDKEFCFTGETHKKFLLESFTGSKFVEMGVERQDEIMFENEVSFGY